MTAFLGVFTQPQDIGKGNRINQIFDYVGATMFLIYRPDGTLLMRTFLAIDMPYLGNFKILKD